MEQVEEERDIIQERHRGEKDEQRDGGKNEGNGDREEGGEKMEDTIVDIVEDHYNNLFGQSGFEMVSDLHPLSGWNFNDMYVRSNSPLASNCTSDIEKDHGDDDADDFSLSQPFTRKKMHRNADISSTEYMLNSPQKYKKFTYEDIEKSLSKYYDKTESNFTEMDLLLTYLRGMRMVYLISKNITNFKSYSVAMVTVSITICLAVIAPFVKNIYWGAYLISSGNALATILLSLSRYLKFDSNSAQYSFLEKQFSKLEARVDFFHTIQNSSSQRFQEIETKLVEMNEYIQNLIPEEAVQLFPLIYRTNIIQFIRKIELYRRNLIIRLRDIKNEIHYILRKWNSSDELEKDHDINPSIPPQREKEKNRILFLMRMKEDTKKELLQCKHIYRQINELFKNEIHYAETHQSCCGCASVWKPTYDFSNLNPIVRDYLKLVMPE